MDVAWARAADALNTVLNQNTIAGGQLVGRASGSQAHKSSNDDGVVVHCEDGGLSAKQSS